MKRINFVVDGDSDVSFTKYFFDSFLSAKSNENFLERNDDYSVKAKLDRLPHVIIDFNDASLAREYQSLRDGFYKEADIVLLCFKLDDPRLFNDIEYIRTFQKINPNLKIIFATLGATRRYQRDCEEDKRVHIHRML